MKRLLPNCRPQKGSSMAMLVLFCFMGSMFTLASAQMLMPTLRAVSRATFLQSAENQMTSSLEWTVQQLNDPSLRSGVDGLTVPISSSINAAPGASLNGNIVVTNALAPTYSAVYDQFTDRNNSTAAFYGGNGWRVATCTVGSGSYQKQLRLLLKPNYGTGPLYGSSGSLITVGTVTQNPMFASAIFTYQKLTASGPLNVGCYNSSGGFVSPNLGNVVSNGSLNLAGGGVAGNIVVTSLPAGNTTSVVASSTPLLNTPGTVQANGLVSGLSSHSITQSGNGAQQQLPPCPLAPPGSTDLGTVYLSGGQTLTISQPGNYIINSLTLLGTASINVAAAGPVNIYLQGNGSSRGIYLGGHGITNSTHIPANVCLWYTGSGTIQMPSNSNFTGVIYAPSATIALGAGSQISGALVGNVINCLGACTLHYDEALLSNASLQYPTATARGGGLLGALLSLVLNLLFGLTSPVQGVVNYQVVSWHEVQ